MDELPVTSLELLVMLSVQYSTREARLLLSALHKSLRSKFLVNVLPLYTLQKILLKNVFE